MTYRDRAENSKEEIDDWLRTHQDGYDEVGGEGQSQIRENIPPFCNLAVQEEGCDCHVG